MSNEITTQLKFDVSRITAKEMAAFFKATKANELEDMASLFAKTAAECPPEWGAPNDPDTYMNRPYFTEFKQIIQRFVDTANEQAKN